MTRTKRITGRLFTRGDKGTYYLAWMARGVRHTQSLGTTKKREAEAEATRVLAPFQAQDEAETVAAMAARLDTAKENARALAPSLHLGLAWQAYLDAEKRKEPGPGTLRDYESMFYALRDWLAAEHPEARTMRDVTPDLARAFLRSLDKGRGLSGDRVNKHLFFLRSMFALLADHAALATNPWDGIPKRDHQAAHRRPLTIEEMRNIIEAAEGELRTLLMVGTFTGLRLGDAATLRWDECDLVRGIIRRVPRKTARHGVAVTIGIPEILGQHLAELPRAGHFIMPEMARLYLARKEYLSRRIQAHFMRCGIETLGEGPGRRAACVAGFHSLRHAYISLQAQAGTPQAVLQKLAGHKNPMMTEHYTHLDAATAAATARALPAILGNTEPKREPLPAWAVEAVKNARTLKALRAELLGGGA